MAIVYLAGNRISGLSTDTKPTPGNTVVNAIFEETDTALEFINNNTAWIPRSLPRHEKYTIVQVGSTVYCIDENGKTVSSSSTPQTVIQYALDNLTAGRTWKDIVKIRGNYTISKITIPSFVTLDLHNCRLFQANATNTLMIENADATNGNTDIEFIGGLVDGNRVNQTGGGTADTTSLLRFTKCNNVSVHDGKWIHANYHCLYFKNPTTGIIVSNNRFENWKQEGVHLMARDLASGVSSGHIGTGQLFHTSQK